MCGWVTLGIALQSPPGILSNKDLFCMTNLAKMNLILFGLLPFWEDEITSQNTSQRKNDNCYIYILHVEYRLFLEE